MGDRGLWSCPRSERQRHPGTPDITYYSNKKLLVARYIPTIETKRIATRSKDATSNKGITTSSKGITTSSKAHRY